MLWGGQRAQTLGLLFQTWRLGTQGHYMFALPGEAITGGGNVFLSQSHWWGNCRTDCDSRRRRKSEFDQVGWIELEIQTQQIIVAALFPRQVVVQRDIFGGERPG